MNEIFGMAPTDAGAVALLTLVVLFILTGRLIPRRTHEDLIADRDNWRSAFLESEALRKVEHDQTGELLDMAKLTGPLLAALPQPQQAAREEVNPGDRMAPTPPQAP
ncbi:hypothetical protein ACIRF8_15635 [Streptomyces sp. NPDC102406]|uniref:hypothetical protein n=1 Tax=Streptomyces sp. NPDC102406 TaxID=3366171 RepID=UPI00382AB3F4